MYILRYLFGRTLTASLFLFFGATSVVGQTGRISGSVIAGLLKPVSHAYVTALITPTSSSTKPFSTTAITGSDGSFVLTALPAGAFNICVQAPGTNYLNPCQWSLTPPAATITNGQALALAPIELTLGYRYQVRVNDPTGAILQSEASKSGAELLMYVWAGGSSAPLAWGADDSLGRIYQVLVPIATPFRFTLQGKKYQVVDQNGAAVNLTAGITSSLNIPATAVLSAVATGMTTSPDLTYQIVGVSP